MLVRYEIVEYKYDCTCKDVCTGCSFVEIAEYKDVILVAWL